MAKKSQKSQKSAAPVAPKAAALPISAAATVSRKPNFPETAKILVVASENPKRAGSKAHAKWALYKGAKTVADVIAAFAKAKYPRRRAMSALRWDSGHGFIKIG